jgi:hypothetical protein
MTHGGELAVALCPAEPLRHERGIPQIARRPIAEAISHHPVLELLQLVDFAEGLDVPSSVGGRSCLPGRTRCHYGRAQTYEWAEREYRQWFWRCAPDQQVL